MSADTGAGAKNLYARMTICERNGFPYIHAEFIGKAREFVGNGDIDITIGVFHQLDHFCGGCIGLDDFAFDEDGIKVSASFGGFQKSRRQ